MQTGSESAGGKSDQSGGGVDPRKEAAYWREQHSKQEPARDFSRHGGSATAFRNQQLVRATSCPRECS